MIGAALLASVAIVAQDQAALRAAPRDSAPQQAVLWQGDALEVRGARMDYLQVYDHRRERAGWVRASQLRGTSLQPEEAGELLAVLRFVKDTPGAEALGIAYAAAYLKAAPAEAISAEPFDALGTLAERLARRANAARSGRDGEAVAARLEVAAQYGVKFTSYERNATLTLCYDGEAFRRVLAMSSDAEPRARAALALTRHDCVDPDLTPARRLELDRWRAEVLDRVTAAQFAQLPETLKNRLRLRQAGVWSALAFEHARRGEDAMEAGQRALNALAGVQPGELSDDDQIDYAEAAVRTGASRWAAEAQAAPAGALAFATEPGEPGQTCVKLIDPKLPAAAPLARRCSYGTVWLASASVNPNRRAAAIAVQPLAGWRELWLFRRDAGGWHIDVLPPAASEPELGVVEFAGWVPGGAKLLVAREARVDGRVRRSFEVLSLASLAVEKSARTPQLLALFNQWQDPRWKRVTVSLR